MRALAVLSVIADHLFHWPNGGFIGVDVFFVISGFLITGLLLREYERTGHISFADFYRRRVKRILPASLLVLMVTLGVSFMMFSQSRFTAVAWDTVWAFFFAANWRFASVGTDYFQAGGPTSPIQHFWSLAVEEQFYFVWPWAMLLIFVLFARFKKNGSARIAVGALLAVLCVASFVWAVQETAFAPTLAYFSTLSRAWELGIGALIAVAAPTLTRLPAALRPVLAWIGLAGIVTSLFVISSASAFPAPAAALPVLATALVILAGTGGQVAGLWPLTNPAARYVGDISYSLYLWHFPVIILAGSVLDLADPTMLAIVLGLVLMLSSYSYHLIEDPIRKGNLLWPNKKANRNKEPLGTGYVLTALSLLAVVSLCLAFAALAPSTAAGPMQARPAANLAVPAAAEEPKYGPVVTGLQTELKRALASPEWPALAPSIDDSVQNERYQPKVWECGSVEPPSVEECTWGNPDASHTAVLVGDSISLKWVAPLMAIYGQGDWKLRVLARFGCPYTDTEKTFTDGLSQTCQDRKSSAVDRINSDRPDLVFVANTSVLPVSKNSGKTMTASEWHDGLASFLGKFAASSKVVVLSAPPASKDVKECYTPRSQPADCVSEVTGKWYEISDAEKRAASSANGLYLDTRSLFCTVENLCPAFVGTTPVKRDMTHMTLEYSQKIEPGLRELVVAAGLPS